MTHFKIKSFKCRQCNYATSRPSYIREHIDSAHLKLKLKSVGETFFRLCFRRNFNCGHFRVIQKSTPQIFFHNFQQGTPKIEIWNDVERKRMTLKHIKNRTVWKSVNGKNQGMLNRFCEVRTFSNIRCSKVCHFADVVASRLVNGLKCVNWSFCILIDSSYGSRILTNAIFPN